MVEALSAIPPCSDFVVHRSSRQSPPRKENAILMANHISDLDTVIALILAQAALELGSALTIVKKTTLLLPVRFTPETSAQFASIYGWACWFSEFVFLDRDWNKDKITLEKALATRRPDKLHVPKNVLIPRTKGFVAAVQQLRARVPAIYDVTIAVPKSDPRPSMLLRVIQMKPSLVHIHVKRYPITEIPKSDEGIAQWCKVKFVAKDHLIDKFQTQGTFGDQEIGIPGRSRMSLLVFVSISCMISVLGVTIYQRFPFLSTQKGIGLFGVMLASAGVLSHTFIEFTKLPPMPNKLSSIE
ncbi:hypothetical protein ACFE04_028392 [Oxalis oulophora]